MRTLLLLLLTMVSNTLFAQTENFSTLITKGKEAYAQAEYIIAANYFEKQF